MERTIVSYDTQHGSAKKIATRIAEILECECLNIDTPHEIEDLSKFDNIVMVFNFRGPYTAQLTKLYLSRVKAKFKGKNVFIIGEGIFSEKEFPMVAAEIQGIIDNTQTFNTYFIRGQLRVATLTREEKIILGEFSRIYGMEITDMGELNVDDANPVAQDIIRIINENPVAPVQDEQEHYAWVCSVCQYVHNGPTPPDKCPLCGMPADKFEKK